MTCFVTAPAVKTPAVKTLKAKAEVSVAVVPPTAAAAPDEQEVVSPEGGKTKRKKRKRQNKTLKTKVEPIGCGCRAKIVMRVEPDNSIIAKFHGHHNHDVQSLHLVRHVNPIIRSVQ